MLLTLVLTMAGCGSSPISSPTPLPFDLPSALPASNKIAGWNTLGESTLYNKDNVFNLVDGQAEAFFAYNFEQVAVQKYQNSAGSIIMVEIWQLASPADAFGLFTISRSGFPIQMGNDGDTSPGQRLAFWQNRYYASVDNVQGASDDDLKAYAQAVASALPSGGDRPTLVSKLPKTGLEENGYVFFRKEISIQDEIWLGGENILKLGPDTSGAMGRYKLGNQPARLMLVEYANADQAAAGLQALKSSQTAKVISADVNGTLLGAVFGKVDQASASTLLTEALGNK